MKLYFKTSLLAATALLTALGTFTAKADLITCGIDLGEFRAAGFVDGHGRTVHWGVFTTGGNSAEAGGKDDFKDSEVFGDVGVAGGSFKMTSSTIHGRLYSATNVDVKIKGSQVTEGVEKGGTNADTILNQGVLDANRISMEAAGMPATDNSLTTVNLKNHNYTYTLTSTCTVLHLTDFAIKNGTFTLVGTASDGIIINVSRNFSLANAHIVLSGGLTWDNVLFNIIGTGKTVTLQGGSTMQGILLATHRRVRLRNHSRVDGEVIANNVELSSQSRVSNPSVASQ